MSEQYFRDQIELYCWEQDIVSTYDRCDKYSTALLCLLAAIDDYSFSDEMISSFPNFIPTEEEIKKYK
jgi:hypothetical protein